MKKNCILLCLIVMFICSGCVMNRNVEPLETGIWYSESICEKFDDGSNNGQAHFKESTLFSKAKYELKEITKEEYKEASGENVFIDAYTMYDQEKRYMQVKLYLMPIGGEEYILAKLTNLEHYVGDAGYQYYGNIYIDLNNMRYDEGVMISFGIGDITIEINKGMHILFDVNK